MENWSEPTATGNMEFVRIMRRIAEMQRIPVRTAEGSVVGEAGGRAAGSEGLQRSRHVVAIQGCNAGAGGAVGIGCAGSRRPWDVVARRGRARAAGRRRDHGDCTWWYIVAFVRVATPVRVVIDGGNGPRAGGVPSCWRIKTTTRLNGFNWGITSVSSEFIVGFLDFHLGDFNRQKPPCLSATSSRRLSSRREGEKRQVLIDITINE